MGHNNSLNGLLADLTITMLLNNPLSSVPLPRSALNFHREIEEVIKRSRSEGVVFFTTQLPAFGKALDAGLNTEHYVRPDGFAAAPGDARPLFMRALTSVLFDEQGNLADVADWAKDDIAVVISFLRQLCFFAYKLEIPFSAKQRKEAEMKFVAIDSEVQDYHLFGVHAPLSGGQLRIAWFARWLLADVFRGFDPTDITPRHGPGAVADGYKGDDKWLAIRESVITFDPISDFPHWRYNIASLVELDVPAEIELRLVDKTSKVVFVPKDSRGPRTIACEPLGLQWLQQGIGRAMVQWLEGHELTAGFVNFRDQSINQKLAMNSSITGQMATLDLSDASDRVSLSLVRELFGELPSMLRAFEETRSTHALLPSGAKLRLHKFAPMGSALCFPVEATIFWALCVSAIAEQVSRDDGVTHAVARGMAGHCVYVYGDDIIVPVEYVDLVIDTLEAFGLRVNRAKSCYLGDFRESCGVDAWNGFNITPLRMRKLPPSSLSDGQSLAATVSLANRLSDAGYPSTSARLFREVECLTGTLPWGTVDSGYLCRWARSATLALFANAAMSGSLVLTPIGGAGDSNSSETEEASSMYVHAHVSIPGRFGPNRFRWNNDLHVIEVRAFYLSATKVPSTLDGYPRLLRNLVMGGHEDFDPSETVIPYSVELKVGWKTVA